jgi:CRP-like cAMP-binding protein
MPQSRTAARNAQSSETDEAALTPTRADSVTLTRRSTKALLKIGVIRHWQSGQVILSRGQSLSAALLLIEGRLRVSVITPEGEEQLLRWLLPGEISGLSSVFAEISYPADLVAAVPSAVLHIERTKLMALIRQDGELAIDLIRILGLRINQLFDTLATQGMPTLEKRVWSTLERIARLNSVQVPEGVQLCVSQSDLAQAAMASRQRVNQQLRRLQDQGLIRLGYRNIILLKK